jgi:hypothetical protein
LNEKMDPEKVSGTLLVAFGIILIMQS